MPQFPSQMAIGICLTWLLSEKEVILVSCGNFWGKWLYLAPHAILMNVMHYVFHVNN